MNAAWQEKKRQVWMRSLGMCERCKQARGAHVHHLRYAQRRGHEPLEWLQLVCLKCHGEYHPHHTFLTPEQQRQRAKAKASKKATTQAKICKHCGGTYSKHKHKAICVKFHIHH